ncbi:CoA-transferase family III domain-containing protein [Staphylotrichum tortipilum]|uniref:CoA-transferase family III domain-containing protein n=1 Tax=Staphylotrichum tortipilum TaxID=2831512 RepID=A0AAN6RR34_9PEZI|nr:CoA-transferase family III domain-containing protein [Staphylotrichum longicolle]
MTRVLAGPSCTQILGDLGADVIKIEHPERGDDTRAWGPPYAPYTDASPHKGPGESAYFLAANRNKKSLALSYQDPAGVDILHKLAAKCDILVENYIPGSLAKYGLDYETMRKINPALIYASITGYGQTGPYSPRAGYDVMVEAEFGLMHITGTRDGPPVKVGVAVTDLMTGLYTSNSIMAALLARQRTGRGQQIDVALSDCQTAALANIASSCLISGKKDSGRWGTAHPSIVPYKSFNTKDGEILFGGGNDRLFGILCDGLGRPEWKEDPKFKLNDSRVANRVELEAEIDAIALTKTTQEWLDVFEGKGMPYAPMNDVQTTLNHEHTKARGMVVEVEHGDCGPIRMVNTPVKYSESTPGIRTPPPTLGQHTDEVLREHLGMDEAEIEGRLEPSHARDEGPKKEDEPKEDAVKDTTPAPAPKLAPSPAPTPSPGLLSAPEPSPGPASGPIASFTPSRPLYIPQFTAATQMILKRMKGEPSSLSAALSHASQSPLMTMQMPAAPPARPSPSTLPAPAPIAPKPTSNTAGMSAIRKVIAGLTASSKPTPIKPAAPKAAPSEPKPKKPKPSTLPRSVPNPHKRKRSNPQPHNDSDNSSPPSSPSSATSTPSTPASPHPATLPSSIAPTPLTKTKSGRQVLKPASYNPTAMDAASKRPRGPVHHYGKRTAEQALCRRCSRMHSPAANQIVFCDGCDGGWHQLCHEPRIEGEVVRDTSRGWWCAGCQRKREREREREREKVAAAAGGGGAAAGGNKKQKVGGTAAGGEQVMTKGSWAGRAVQQKRAYLSTLPQQELVGLLMACLETHPDLPVFPVPVAGTTTPADQGAAPRSLFAGTTTEGLFPRADAHPGGQINFVRKVKGAGKGGSASRAGSGEKGKGGAGSLKEESQERGEGEEEEFDPLAALWARAGMGLYARLALDTEDDARLVDEGDYEAFSVIVYDERGRKVDENGMRV